MSNWLSKLGHGLVTGAKIAQTFSPILGVIPGAGVAIGLANAISGGILRAQAAVPAPGSGASKAQLVVQEFEAALETTKQIAAASGKSVTYDQAKLQAAIDAQVAAYKLIADAIDTIRISDTPTPAPPAQ